jgi:hypothetical protein
MFLCIMNIAFIHVTFLWMNNRVLNWKPTPLGIIKPWSSYIYMGISILLSIAYMHCVNVSILLHIF